MAKYVQATCQLQAEVNELGVSSGVAGRFLIYGEPGGNISINGVITGLSEGLHGFHIHESSAISDGCAGAGGHFSPTPPKANFDDPDPEPAPHGAPAGERGERHVGDLGNIEANALGTAVVSIEDHLCKMDQFYGVVGRSIVVHAGEDDLGLGGDEGSLSTGNAGARVGCCVIRPVQNSFLPSGARCERGSEGPRPRCGLEHECCGYVLLAEEGPQIEICHDEKAVEYSYQGTSEGAAKEITFACISGAYKLAATISAFGAAAYMLV